MFRLQTNLEFSGKVLDSEELQSTVLSIGEANSSSRESVSVSSEKTSFEYTKAQPFRVYSVLITLLFRNHTAYVVGGSPQEVLTTRFHLGMTDELIGLVGPDRFRVEWSDPSTKFNTPVTSYIVSIDDRSQTVLNPAQIAFTMGNSNPHRSYLVRVIAVMGNRGYYLGSINMGGSVIRGVVVIPAPADALVKPLALVEQPASLNRTSRWRYAGFGILGGAVIIAMGGGIGWFVYQRRHRIVNFNKLTVSEIVKANPSKAVEAHKLLELDDL